MNRPLLSVALALALNGSFALGQQSNPPSQATPADGAPVESRHAHHRANPHREAAMLARHLNLTSDQAEKLEPILADRDQKLASLRTDASLAPEAKHSQMRSIRLDTQQQLSNILTPEQMQKMESMHHRHGGHEQAPAAPSGL